MEFSEIQELNNMIEYSQTYHQDGLTVMQQQLNNTPKSSFIKEQQQQTNYNNRFSVQPQNQSKNISNNNQYRNTLMQPQKVQNNNNMNENQFYEEEQLDDFKSQNQVDQHYKNVMQSINNNTQLVLQENNHSEESADDILKDLENFGKPNNDNNSQQNIDTNNTNNQQISSSSSFQEIDNENQKQNKLQESKKNNNNNAKKKDNDQKQILDMLNTYQRKQFGSDDDDSEEDSDDDESEQQQNQQQQKSNSNNNTQPQQQQQQQNDLAQQQQKNKSQEDKGEERINQHQTQFERLTPNKNIASTVKKSILSQNMIQGRTQSSVGMQSQFQSINNPNMKKIEVFFFSSPEFKLIVNVLKNIKVSELIKIIIQNFLADEKCDSSRIKYPENPEAYELRILDDDDCYKPDMSFPSINTSRFLHQIEFDQIAFIENESFKPAQALAVKKQNEIHPEMSKILNKKNIMALTIEVKDYENDKNSFKTLQQIGLDKQIGDLFELLNKKNKKIYSKHYIILRKEKDNDYEEIDLSMPVHMLKQNPYVLLKKKNFADGPKQTQYSCQSFVQGLIQEQLDSQFVHDKEDSDNEGDFDKQNNIPLNLVQASKYEEFEVIKTNNKGKKQQRILGIDQYKIFNINPAKLTGQHLGLIDQLFNNKMTGTKKQERLIEDIVGIYYVEPSGFKMSVKNDATVGEKTIKYDTAKPQTAKKIVNKVSFLMKLQYK